MNDDEIKTDEQGHRYIEGLNGKRWRLAPLPAYGDARVVQGMSAVYYGNPPLNEREQEIYDLVLPLVCELTDDAQEQFEDPTTFRGTEPVLSLDPEDLAYRIAETIVAKGTVKP